MQGEISATTWKWSERVGWRVRGSHVTHLEEEESDVWKSLTPFFVLAFIRPSWRICCMHVMSEWLITCFLLPVMSTSNWESRIFSGSKVTKRIEYEQQKDNISQSLWFKIILSPISHIVSYIVLVSKSQHSSPIYVQLYDINFVSLLILMFIDKTDWKNHH